MLLSGFVVALSIVLSALIGCGVANFFLDGKSARIAGFAFSIGSLSGLTHFNDGGSSQLSAAVGAISGLLLVWYLFFKENRFAVDQNSAK
ncbi:hypothetical protein [Qipengyuania sp. 483]